MHIEQVKNKDRSEKKEKQGQFVSAGAGELPGCGGGWTLERRGEEVGIICGLLHHT